MKKFIYILLSITIIFSFVGCSKVAPSEVAYDIPQGREIQEVLDQMAAAMVAKDIDAYAHLITSSCPQRILNIKRLRESFIKTPFSKYTYTIKKLNLVGDGISCTAEMKAEGASQEASGKSSFMDSKEYFFIKENDVWKLADFNYHPIMNPSIVVARESIAYDSASELAKSLNSKLYTDINHVQLYGDVIMVGEPYENASIIDLELEDHTTLRVTDEYPGEGKGVVQVLTGIHDYRYVITIQGSNSSTTIMAVDFMSQYMKENQFIRPGVYIIENSELRAAKPLEVSVLSSYDLKKAEVRMAQVQKTIEANIQFIQDELISQRDPLVNHQKNVDNPFMDDYYTAFTSYDQNMSLPQGSSMGLIAANSTDTDLCKAAFELPIGGSEGAMYAFSDYAVKNMIHIAPASYATTLLRLSGFSEDQVFNSVTTDHVINFFNIGTGYLVEPSAGEDTSVKRSYDAQEIISLENDSQFVNYKTFTSNMTKDHISSYAGMLNSLYESNRDLTESRIKRNEFKEDESIQSQPFTYNTDFVFSMLKTSTLEDNSLPMYSSLFEAKEQLRAVMGEFLSMKSTEFLYNRSSKYPGSQYDYGRYAAGFINVENPHVYAQAAEKSKLIEKAGNDIKIKRIDYDYRWDEMVSFLNTIDTGDESQGKFTHPDFCIINKKGSLRDKALLAFGLYLNIFGKGDNAYVVLGRESAYLAFEKNGVWSFLDCKDNNLKDYLDDDVYMAFNMSEGYNEELDLGEKPEFLQ